MLNRESKSLMIAVAVGLVFAATGQADSRPLKVFILAGQSNMEGHARIETFDYIDIEGGLGWWRDTHFPTTTPKFIMGGVGPNFSVIANGPG